MTTMTIKTGQSMHGFPLEKPMYEDSPISLPLFGGICVSAGLFLEVVISHTLLVAQVSQEEDPASKTIHVNIYRSVDGLDLEASIPCLSSIAQDTT
jgi:hypothetical protein